MDEARLVEAVLRNRGNQIILERLPEFGLADAWLVSGSVFQTVWNVLTGRAPDYGIKDYDIFYFDADTFLGGRGRGYSPRSRSGFRHWCFGRATQSARVHLWYSKKFGIAYSPLQRATEGIDRFLTWVAQVGIRPVERGYDVYAPHGLDDISTLTIRPNRCPNFRADLYEAKAASWKARWPELTILPATDPQS
jgi:uncharacterized protein